MWCKKGNVEMGEVLTVAQVWELSKLWYRDRMEAEFAGRTIAEAHSIFEALGLNTPFWRFE